MSSLPSLTSFSQLAVAVGESFDYFDSAGALSLSQKTAYLTEILKTFHASKEELELYSLFDASKPYTRNIVFEGSRFAICLYCWNPESTSHIHNHPCEVCLVTPLSGSLKIERFSYAKDTHMTLQRSQVKFYLESQIALLGDSLGIFRISNPRKYVQACSLSIIYPPYKSHTTWNTESSPPQLTRVGCFSIRGIRTPRLEARLGLHGQVLTEIKEKSICIAPNSVLRIDKRTKKSDAGSKQISKDGISYQLGDSIGRGSFGSVYQALNIKTGHFVAVKELRIPAGRGPQSIDSMKAIEAEITFLQTFDHPNIIRYVDTIRESNTFYIITEFMESRSVAHILSSFCNFDENLIRTYTTQILSGLHYLHERHVLHRDIKGANILVSKRGVVKLADFGIALQIHDNGLSGEVEVVGSPYWMSPEIIQQKPSTTKSDIWSFGCLVVEMISGAPPYFELNAIRAFFKIVDDRHPPLPISSPELAQLLLECFQKEPDKRPSAQALLSHPWMLVTK